MIITKRLNITPASMEDIDTIMGIENHVANRDFIWQGSYEEHKSEIEHPDALLLLFKTKSDQQLVGYTLIHLDRLSDKFELRRIAITEKGNGYGFEVMNGIIKYAFEKTNTNRFWLDVYPDNHVGINLYEKLGLHKDGVLRANYKSERGYLDMIVYSLLRSEYENRL